MPTRESFERIGWLRPVTHLVLEPARWRFTRRTVPRAVALGLIVGVMVPVAQIVLAAILSFPFRANVPVASATTLVTNPLTTPPIWAGAYWLGGHLLGPGLSGDARDLFHRPEGMRWLDWLIHDVGPALLLGLTVVALVSAAVGYVATALGWRWWIARRWRRRARLRHGA